MSGDSQGNPSQPHCVSVSWLNFICRPEYLLVCSLCWKNLGIASAGAAGLKELAQSFSRQGKPTIRFLFPARRAINYVRVIK